jgi:hypothetical protein
MRFAVAEYRNGGNLGHMNGVFKGINGERQPQ